MFELPDTSGLDWFGTKAKNYNNALNNQKTAAINQVSTAGNEIVNNLNAFSEDAVGFTKENLGEEYTNKLGAVESGYNQTKADAMTQASRTGAGVSSTAMNAQTKVEGAKQSDMFNTDLSLQQKAINQANAGHEQQINNAQRNYSMMSSLQNADERGIFGKALDYGVTALSAASSFLPF